MSDAKSKLSLATQKKIVWLLVVVIAVAVILKSCDAREGKAIIAVKGVLKSPATADFQGTKVMWEEGDRTLVHVAVDAQNSFGAKLRNEFCVCLRKQSGIQEPKFVRECKVDPSNRITFSGEIASCTLY